MRHMNLIVRKNKYNNKRAPRSVIVAKTKVMWVTNIKKIYIDNEKWVYFIIHSDLYSRKIKVYLI